MSYSRWSNSIWYTYWCASDAKLMQDEVFEICMIKSFKYKELKELGINKCIEKVKKIEKKATNKEYDELKGYMKEFMKDVEKEYKDNPDQLYHDGKIDKNEYFVRKL